MKNGGTMLMIEMCLSGLFLASALQVHARFSVKG